MARVLDEDELIEQWTLIGDELDLLTGRTGPSKLGLALWLKFFTVEDRFPTGRAELPDEAVGYVASQVKVAASDLGLFDWEGRTAERHRKAVRTFLGFRECSVPDAEKLTTWLADEVCSRERRAERVRAALLVRLREERIEQPSRIRLGRMIGSALRQSEEVLTAKVSCRLAGEVTARMWSMIAAAGGDPGDPDGWQDAAAGNETGEVPGPEAWAAIRSDPGNVSLNTCKSERRKLDWITRETGLAAGRGQADGRRSTGDTSQDREPLLARCWRSSRTCQGTRVASGSKGGDVTGGARWRPEESPRSPRPGRARPRRPPSPDRRPGRW